MSQELEVRDERAAFLPAAAPSLIGDDEITRLFRIANALAASGMYKDVVQGEQAFAKMIVGRDLGLSPAQSMQLYIVEGSIQVPYPMMLMFIRAREGYAVEKLEHTREKCVLRFLVDGEEVGVSDFSMEDARDANLASKDVWKKYPRNMLFARALSNGVKWFIPEVASGLSIYVPEELEGVHVGAIDGGETAAGALPPADPIWEYVEKTMGAEDAERLRAVIERAGWNLAEVQMKLDGQSRGRLMATLAALEDQFPATDSTAEEDPDPEDEPPAPDADKLDEREHPEEEEPDKLDDKEASAGRADPMALEHVEPAAPEMEPPPDGADDLAILDHRIEQLRAALESGVTDEQAAELELELDMCKAERDALTGEARSPDPDDDGPATLL